jgi:segregation and condensation protein B
MDRDQLKAVLESMLFVSDTPLSVKRTASILKDAPVADVAAAFAAVMEEVNALNRSFQVKEVAEGYLLTTRPGFHRWAREIHKVVTVTRLTRQAMEALAIIAYKQPVTRAEVEAIRGVEVGSVMQTLLERKMIRILGRAETVGRPLLYGTTHDFLIHFGLKDLTDLPRVSEIQELAGDQISTVVMMEMEGELRRREAKLGLEPMNLDFTPGAAQAADTAAQMEAAAAEDPNAQGEASTDTQAGEAPSATEPLAEGAVPPEPHRPEPTE